ncbi:MAG: endonuclease/exonuclease/phosphatase family protein [Propionibacteriaceae bacterium]|nr:endonuclease/exonuclease/phosphatase family protein [Propionibacteriaceae bacterium]
MGTVAIPSSADLNSYTSSGQFSQNANAGAASGSNYPEPYAGLLEVASNGSSMVWQRYTLYSGQGGRVWERGQYSSAWSAWRRTDLRAGAINAANLEPWDSTAPAIKPPSTGNWTLPSQPSARRRAGWCLLNAGFQTTSATGTGNISDITIGTLSVGFRPITTVSWSALNYNGVGYISASGDIVLTSIERSLPAGTTLWVQLAYLLADWAWASQITIATYNVREACLAEDQVSAPPDRLRRSWQDRADNVAAEINAVHPDIVFLQEASTVRASLDAACDMATCFHSTPRGCSTMPGSPPTQSADLIGRLTGYVDVGNAQSGNHILIRSATMAGGTTWSYVLSPNDSYGDEWWTVLATLTHKPSNKTVNVATAHITHDETSSYAVDQVTNFAYRISQLFGNSGTLIVGADFNSGLTLASSGLASLTGLSLADVYEFGFNINGHLDTWNEFGPSPAVTRRPDRIFTRNVTTQMGLVNRIAANPALTSDHNLVYATMLLP